MHYNPTHSCPYRNVSVSQAFVRAIVQGKVGKPVDFGEKLVISVVDVRTLFEGFSIDA